MKITKQGLKMKFLHINNFDYPDYLNDMMYHGGFSLFGSDYETNKDPSYMFVNHETRRPEIHLFNCHGKGFTIYKKLTPNKDQKINEDIISKINNQYFDYIIFGSIWRHLDYYEIVKNIYPKNKIILIDGEDHGGIKEDLINCGIYFKRELQNNYQNQVLPIGFSIPKELIDFNINIKNKEFSYIDPRDTSTYIYDNETDYYNDYKSSRFGFTMKKAGWDCLRHYEIIMNGCLPMFLNLEQCPVNTMTHFPKQILQKFYTNFLDANLKYDHIYNEIIHDLQSHVLEYCSTENMFKYVLNYCRKI